MTTPTRLSTEGAWQGVLHGRQFAALLPGYVRERRWFGGKARRIASAEVRDTVQMTTGAAEACVCFIEVVYEGGDREMYVLPVTYASGVGAQAVRDATPHAVVCQLDARGQRGILYDAVYDPAFCHTLLTAVEQGRQFAGEHGRLVAEPTAAFERLRGEGELSPRVSRAEQSNSSIIFGDRLIMKLFRRAVPGLNPDIEIGRFLTEQEQFGQIAPVAGSAEFRLEAGQPMSLAVLLGFVPNQGDAWEYVLELLKDYRQQVSGRSNAPPPPGAVLGLVGQPAPQLAEELFGDHLLAARLLGRRTAEMHLALAAAAGDADFLPERFGRAEQRAEAQAMHQLAERSFAMARDKQASLPPEAQAEAQAVLAREATVHAAFDEFGQRPLSVTRTRAHGDYHLGQVLYTGSDFVIIDFEGEPARSLDERRQKRSPLRDVAGMLRSFDYAAASGLAGDPSLERWARFWVAWVSAAFLNEYVQVSSGASFMPSDPEELDALLKAYLIEKAVYELLYELNNRPDWMHIPVQGILRLVGGAAAK